jgi:hypothetical protein
MIWAPVPSPVFCLLSFDGNANTATIHANTNNQTHTIIHIIFLLPKLPQFSDTFVGTAFELSVN